MPERGVYFVQEDGDDRLDTGHGPRIVRVGTRRYDTKAPNELVLQVRPGLS